MQVDEATLARLHVLVWVDADADPDVDFVALERTLKEAVREQGHYEPAEFLPFDFSHAAITIADKSPRLGEPLGLKLDWL